MGSVELPDEMKSEMWGCLWPGKKKIATLCQSKESIKDSEYFDVIAIVILQ